MMPFEKFVASYIETALWSSTDDAGEPLDSSKYANAEFTDSAKARVENDCQKFVERITPLLDPFTSDYPVAHDFWLTRNRHGAGFWDGDYPEPLATQLTEVAHAFGECNLYATVSSIETD